MAKKKHKRAGKIIRKAAKVNGVVLSETILISFDNDIKTVSGNPVKIDDLG